MPRRPRIINAAVAAAVRRGAALAQTTAQRGGGAYAPPPQSPAEKLYDLIYAKAVEGYCFTDSIYGIPWIRREDVAEVSPGVFVARFRCPPEKAHDAYFGRMAKAVCEAVGSKLHYVHATRKEYGIPYEEFAWAISFGEKR